MKSGFKTLEVKFERAWFYSISKMVWESKPAIVSRQNSGAMMIRLIQSSRLSNHLSTLSKYLKLVLSSLRTILKWQDTIYQSAKRIKRKNVVNPQNKRSIIIFKILKQVKITHPLTTRKKRNCRVKKRKTILSQD